MIRSTRLPAFGAVVELLEAAELAILGRSLKARLGAGLEALDMPAECRGRRDAQDVIEAVGLHQSRTSDSNNGYHRAAGSWCLASWRGSLISLNEQQQLREPQVERDLINGGARKRER